MLLCNILCTVTAEIMRTCGEKDDDTNPRILELAFYALVRPYGGIFSYDPLHNLVEFPFHSVVSAQYSIYYFCLPKSTSL